MRQSERSWRLHEVLVRVDQVVKDFPAMLGRLADYRESGERVPVSGGGISDPTSSAAASSVDLLRDIDKTIKELHSRAEKLARIRDSLVGHHGPPPIVDEEGRLIRDDKGRSIEYCELHRLVGSNVQARRSIPNPDGSGTKIRVCRWCGDYYDKTGTAPTTQQCAANASGQRVKAHAPTGAPLEPEDGKDILERLNAGHPRNDRWRAEKEAERAS